MFYLFLRSQYYQNKIILRRRWIDLDIISFGFGARIDLFMPDNSKWTSTKAVLKRLDENYNAACWWHTHKQHNLVRVHIKFWSDSRRQNEDTKNTFEKLSMFTIQYTIDNFLTGETHKKFYGSLFTWRKFSKQRTWAC